MSSKPPILWRNLKILRKSGKIRKKSVNRKKIRKIISSCHIWWVKHPLCEEIWSKPLKSEDLRRIIKKTKKNEKKRKKKVIFKLRSFAHEVKIKVYIFINILTYFYHIEIIKQVYWQYISVLVAQYCFQVLSSNTMYLIIFYELNFYCIVWNQIVLPLLMIR